MSLVPARDYQSKVNLELRRARCADVKRSLNLSGCEHRQYSTKSSAPAGTWGVPFDDVADAYCSEARDRAAGWSWGVVAPDGICGRIFSALGLASSTAVTLLTLPDALGRLEAQEERQALDKLVRAYAEHLDAQLSFTLHGAAPALQLAQRPGDDAAPDPPSREASSTASVSPSSLDKTEAPPPAPDEGEPSAPPAEFERANIEQVEEDALRAALMDLQSDPEALQRIEAQNRSVHAAALSEGAILSEPAFGVLPVYEHKATPQSVAAVQAVVTGAVRGAMPQSRDPDAPRWYDARARVAALRLAHWLRVPCATFTALEVTALSAAAVNAAEPATREQLHKYHASSTQWLKVGAAAVGGGVLTAVTAGLAAPAIVAGVGTMVGMAGSAGALQRTLCCPSSLLPRRPCTMICMLSQAFGGPRVQARAPPLRARRRPRRPWASSRAARARAARPTTLQR